MSTLGPATHSYERIRSLVGAGMDVARLNFSHGSHEDHAQAYRWVRQAAEEAGRGVAVLVHLQGPKIRLGRFAGGPVLWATGETVTITTGICAGDHDRVSRFRSRRNELLARRAERREAVARTGALDFLPQTERVRRSEWTVASAPADLTDRRVEITGPTDPKMAVNALNSGTTVWLADLEDANTPHWRNVVAGQLTLADAVRRVLAVDVPGGKSYRLRRDGPLATLVVRPRGWHLDERHVLVDGSPAAGALVDFGLYFFHNAQELLDCGSGPYFYLPKTESHAEARLWNDVFTFAQERLGIPHGTIRATVLIETILAAFQVDEILYELRDHASGLNAGRWDYLFSVIQTFRDAVPSMVLPDRGDVTMTAPMMRAAMGEMAAFIPSRRDPEVNERAFAKVREDKKREAGDGFDGSWVAHPDLVPVCREAFDEVLGSRPNQLNVRRDVSVTAQQLLDVSSIPRSRTLTGLRDNVDVGVQYLEAWLRGNGAVGIHNLMEDAATAEISRSQIWRWVHNGVVLESGEKVTPELVRRILDEELVALRQQGGEGWAERRYEQARDLFEQVALADEFADFLTLPAYEVVD